MTAEGDKLTPIHFDRHAPDYIDYFEAITHEVQAKCPIAWTETYGGPGVTTSVLGFYTYIKGFKFFDMGYTAALGIIMLFIISMLGQFIIGATMRIKENRP